MWFQLYFSVLKKILAGRETSRKRQPPLEVYRSKKFVHGVTAILYGPSQQEAVVQLSIELSDKIFLVPIKHLQSKFSILI